MDDEADYFKVLAELETSRRNPGALESLGLGMSLAPEPARACTLEQIDLDSGPVLRVPEPERISLLKLCLGALAIFGLMVLLAALFFPADERGSASGSVNLNVAVNVPSCMAEVPDHELHEAFEPEVADAELRLRQQRKQAA
jgi:hypothetical protein